MSVREGVNKVKVGWWYQTKVRVLKRKNQYHYSTFHIKVHNNPKCKKANLKNFVHLVTQGETLNHSLT